jgi:hypothetical protein
MVLGVVPGKKTWQWARASWIAPNRSGNAGRYFSVLNCASENGLSLETCGRLWVLVIPVGEQERDGLRGHRGPPVGMERGLVSTDPLARAGLVDEPLDKHRALPVGHHPAHHVAAEAVEHHVEVEAGPLRRAE